MNIKNPEFIAGTLLFFILLITFAMLVKMPEMSDYYRPTEMEEIISIEEIECKVIDKVHTGFHCLNAEEYLALENGMLVPVTQKEFSDYTVGETYTFRLTKTQVTKMQTVRPKD